MSRWVRPLEVALLIVAGLPLLAYPGVLFANLMSLAGYRSGNESLISYVIPISYLAASTLYPGVYIISIGRYIFCLLKKNNVGARKAVYLPYKMLGLIIVLFLLWLLFSEE